MDAALALDGEELKGSTIAVAKATSKGAALDFDAMPKGIIYYTTFIIISYNAFTDN